MIDVSSLVPEARGPALEAAQAYVRHTRPWFVGMLAHGSALKGGFIPGCSDIDIHIYLREAAFEADGQLPLKLCMAVHRDLSKISPAPFSYIQCYALPERLDAPGHRWPLGPMPGAYHMLAGELLVPEAAPEQVLARARDVLADLKPDPFGVASDLLGHGGGMLKRRVRLLCADVWPTLYNLLTVRMDDPLEVWRLPKDAAIRLLPEDEPLGKEVRRFYRLLLDYYPDEGPVETALAIIQSGIRFRQLAKLSYTSYEGGIR